MTKRTRLYQDHIHAGATLVDFSGWQMPLHYGSQIAEHYVVRRDAGVFDVSHMTVVDLLGTAGRTFLRNILANDVDRLIGIGNALYSCMLNHHGGVLDDLIVYYQAPDHYRLVLNAGTREKDLNWLKQQIDSLSVGIQERLDLSMLAIQGPKAIAKTLSILNPTQMDAVMTLQPFEAIDIYGWFFARTGYTGEDGLEVILPSEQVSAFWQSLVSAGIKPCGLGARDTLRLEAGMMLYGQDMDETVSPLESGLSWSVAMEPRDRDFIGRAALELQLQDGLKRKMVGLVLEDKGVMRSHQKVIIEGVGEGCITSGSFSPTLDCSIALARVPIDARGDCLVEVRDKLLRARIVKPRFVKHGKILKGGLN